ncbi:prepilin-type N-terminal cleavage/methylation domain-containing protein [Acidiferrobacter sp.]|uniref:prepilin-type N-terminal cleavage/methylation domain-containing protein n=1 Tax=Acidiferrobacter sp. TaxID=1872107 RepID=UPI00260B5CEF|nr:prepilin-type N-terminal cleavage/methylation domain-containing protein [Acidiferrobacter sp.]
MSRYRKEQGGFTLIEIIVALAIIVILGTVLFFHFNMSKSKGQALITAMQGIGSAATRFNTDTSCMPTNTGELFNRNLAGTNNYCGIDVASSWNGPYMADRPLDANNNVLLTSIGPSTSLKIVEGAFLNDGNTTQYAVEANNVPNAIADQAYVACGGAQSQCVVQSANSAGQGMTSIDYVFDES